MSIFGPTDTRNFKKLGKNLYDIEIRFAETFCELYGFARNLSKYAVMDTARVYGAFIYLYGVALTNKILEENNASYECSTMINILAKVHKKPVSALRPALTKYDDLDDFKNDSLKEINNALFGSFGSSNPFKQYFDEVEALVKKWERDEF